MAETTDIEDGHDRPRSLGQSTRGNRVRELRGALGISTTELANRIGTTQAHISRIERGLVGLTQMMMELVAGALGVEPYELLPETEGLHARHLSALRRAGWMVAIHNDYTMNGEFYTFWLLTHPDGRYVRGEGRTDALALEICAQKARVK